MTQLEIWYAIANSALNFIFITIISSRDQKQTVTDMKTDLRTTKEDLMAELKEIKDQLEQEIKQ